MEALQGAVEVAGVTQILETPRLTMEVPIAIIVVTRARIGLMMKYLGIYRRSLNFLWIILGIHTKINLLKIGTICPVSAPPHLIGPDYDARQSKPNNLPSAFGQFDVFSVLQ